MELLEFISVGLKSKKNIPYLINNVSFIVNEGDALAIFGNSTPHLQAFFKLIAGFSRPADGVITLDDQVLADDYTYLLPQERNIGIIPKELGLFPHMTVAQNISLGLLGTDSSKKIRLKELLQLVDFKGDENVYPQDIDYFSQLQVAIARALTTNPVLLLLEEPFLDVPPTAKPPMHLALKKIIKLAEIGVIFTTKLLEDAMVLSNKLMVLKEGEIEQFDTTEHIYKFPKNEFVMDLMQYANCFTGKIEENTLTTPFGKYKLDNLKDSPSVYWMVKPDELVITNTPTAVEAKVETSLFYGDHYQINLQTGFGNITARTNVNFESNTKVFVAANAIDLFILENGKKAN